MSESPDTVTPLDGDGHNMVDPQSPVETTENVKQEDYTTQGRTTVATRRGYAFNPTDKSLPQITADGVKMNKGEAEQVIAEAGGDVFVVDENEED